jgi:hypothetical protein
LQRMDRTQHGAHAKCSATSHQKEILP